MQLNHHHLFRKNIHHSVNVGQQKPRPIFCYIVPVTMQQDRYIHTINLPINLYTDLVLFGSTDLTNTLNTDIFLNVQKFIVSSKRFTS